MKSISERVAFFLFHYTLGVVVLIESVRTFLGASSLHASNPLGSHLSLLAACEGVAAILFMIPRTMKIGSWLLLFVFLIAVIVHGVAHELSLLVFAAGVVLVNTRGGGFIREVFKGTA